MMLPVIWVIRYNGSRIFLLFNNFIRKFDT
jgi:hypothetical protein